MARKRFSAFFIKYTFEVEYTTSQRQSHPRFAALGVVHRLGWRSLGEVIESEGEKLAAGIKKEKPLSRWISGFSALRHLVILPKLDSVPILADTLRTRGDVATNMYVTLIHSKQSCRFCK